MENQLIKINPIFRPLLQSRDRYYFLTGGRGAGKSFSVAWSILMLSFEIDHVILYTRLTMVSAAKSVIPEFKAMIEKMGMEDSFEITADQVVNKHSGSVIWFMGLKSSSGANTARLKSLSGVTTWIIDEFEDMSEEEELFDKIDNSIRTKNNQNRVIMVMNPTTKEFWAYDRWFTQPGVKEQLQGSSSSKDGTTYVHTTWLDCAEHLDDSWIKKALRLRDADPKKYEEIYLGGWRSKATGVVLPKWEYGEWYEYNTGQIVFGADWGMRDPYALVKTMIDDKSAKIYVELCHYESGLIETEWFKHTYLHAKGHQVIADGKKPEVIEGFRRKGLSIEKADQSPGSIYKGVSLLNDYTIVVCGEYTAPLTRELNNYVWEDDDKQERPKQNSGYDHAIDAIRYAVWWAKTQKFSEARDEDFHFI